jgi:hypothetical protein
MSWKSSGLPGWLRESSYFRPVAGESNKNENENPSRTFWSPVEEKTLVASQRRTKEEKEKDRSRLGDDKRPTRRSQWPSSVVSSNSSFSLSASVRQYQMGQAPDVCEKSRVAVPEPLPSATELPSGGAVSQHDVGLSHQVHDISAHPLLRPRERTPAEGPVFRVVHTSSPFRGMASAIHQRSMGQNIDALITWAQSLLPVKPAAAEANKKAEANWAATPSAEQRALALRFFEGEPMAQTAAGQPEKANLRGQLGPPRSGKGIPTALAVADKDKAPNCKASQPL